MIKYYQDNTSKKLKVCEFVDGEMEIVRYLSQRAML